MKREQRKDDAFLIALRWIDDPMSNRVTGNSCGIRLIERREYHSLEVLIESVQQ